MPIHHHRDSRGRPRTSVELTHDPKRKKPTSKQNALLLKDAIAVGQLLERAYANTRLAHELEAVEPDARRGREHRDNTRRGGVVRGRQSARRVKRAVADLPRLIERYRMSDELQDKFPTLVAYLTSYMHRHPKTIRRWLKCSRLATKGH